MAGQRSILDIHSARRNPLDRLRRIFSSIKTKKPKQTKPTNRIQRVRYNGHQLVVIRNPNQKDTTYLKRKYNFHHLHLEDTLSPIQRPKIDFEDDYIFFVFHFPAFNPDTLKIESKEIDFFLTEEDVVVIIEQEFSSILEIVEDISKKRSVRSFYFEKGTGILLYHIFDALIDSIFPLVEQIEKVLDEIDKEVFSKEPRNIAERISFLRRNIIYFQSIIKPELTSFAEVEKTQHPLIDEELQAHFENISDHLNKIWDRLEDLNELSDNLSSAFESYLSSKTNEIMKVLTIFSVVLLPLTLLSGIYGMNLSFLPLSHHPLAFAIISLFMLGMVGAMLVAFKWKRWI